MELLWNWTDALVQLLLQPFTYMAILFLMLFYRRNVVVERKLFHVRLHPWGRQTWLSLAWGLGLGLIVSVVMAFIGIALTKEAVLVIWAAAILLLLIRVRFLSFAYAIGLLGMIKFILGFFPSWQPEGIGDSLLETIRTLDITGLLILGGLLLIAEAVLARWQSSGAALPLWIEGKRGKVVGAYQLQGFWLLPLFLLVPASTTGHILPWTPLLEPGWQDGFSMVALPVMLGFSELTRSMLPAQKAAHTFKHLLITGMALLVLSICSIWWSPLAIVASVAVIVLREGLFWLSVRQEKESTSLYVHPAEGLRILAVVPGSPADELGIKAGESIYKVNGMMIRSTEQLHTALRMNSAFCKLEVRNISGESKFLQRAIFAGDHHQLGMLLAPDPNAERVVSRKSLNIWHVIAMKSNVRNERTSMSDKVVRMTAGENKKEVEL